MSGDGPTDDTGEVEVEDERAHLEDVDDGCGCAEIWDQLSERREGGAESE